MSGKELSKTDNGERVRDFCHKIVLPFAEYPRQALTQNSEFLVKLQTSAT